MGWKTRTLEAYGFSFALIAALVDSVPLGFTSSSPTLASAFLSFLKAKALPQGWIMINPNSSASLELGVVTSLTLALLVSYPVVAYAGIRLISKNRLSRRTRVALVAGAIALFYAGAVFGLYFARFAVIASIFSGAGMEPVISGYDFYVFILRGIVGWALALSGPVYLVALVKFRVAR